MAKLLRRTQKVFASQANADQIAVFGSMKTGTPDYSSDVEELQSAEYLQGWQDAILGDKAPYLEEMNGVQYGLSYQAAYMLQEGIPEYDVNTNYSDTAIVKSVNNGIITLYASLSSDNIGNPLSDTTNWKPCVLDLDSKANKNGSSSNTFAVANPVNNSDAVNKSTLDSAIAGITGNWRNAFPSNSYQTLSWTTGATYTAPEDGWFIVSGGFSEGGWAVYNTTTLLGNSCFNNSGAWNEGKTATPVSKGQTVKTYFRGGTINYFRFVYAKGV